MCDTRRTRRGRTPLKIFTSLLAAPFIVFHCSMRHNRTSYTVNRIEGKWKFQIRVSFSWFYFMFLFFCNSPHTVQLHTTKINLLPGGQYSKHIRVAVGFALVRPFWKKNYFFKRQCIQHESANWGHYFCVSYWRRAGHFTWGKEISFIFRSFQDPEYWPNPGDRNTRPSAIYNHALYRLN